MSDDTIRRLYAKHAAELLAFARQRVGSDSSRDVVHDGFVRLMTYGDSAALENPRAYLYRITANAANDRNAKFGIGNGWCDPPGDPDAQVCPAPGPETVFAARDELQRCLAALDELPAIYRHVFLLHRLDGMTQAEIAVALEIPQRTVERYVAKALAHCIARLGR